MIMENSNNALEVAPISPDEEEALATRAGATLEFYAPSDQEIKDYLKGNLLSVKPE